MCNVAHCNLFVLGLPAIDEVHNHIVYILDDIIVLFYQILYGILCLMLTFRFLPVFYERISLPGLSK